MAEVSSESTARESSVSLSPDGDVRRVAGSAGCVFRLEEDSPQFPPHLIDPVSLEILQPVLVGKKRVLTLLAGQRVTVVCQGAKNVLTATDATVNSASCQSPWLRIADRSLSYASLGCKSQVKETLKEMGTCSETGTRIHIGWQAIRNIIKKDKPLPSGWMR